MKVTEKYSDSNKVVEREGSKIIAEYFNAMEEKEQIFFFELFSEIVNGCVSEVAYIKDNGSKRYLAYEN